MMKENKIALTWLVIKFTHSSWQMVNQRQSHHIYSMLLKGELIRAPVTNPQRVLDIGTGTGIWAIDYAEQVLNDDSFQI